ncbi:hypothetical protein POTOM_051888 [Populus tomentosa]|uniref:Uncharacterized protein n=1 Tax=Populus tomentosa TaxID=118781 RepID=A0A8X7Y999_POPTO|nr:hypothetical protein POTOM_051888 [Populus tomentosa]
MASLMVGALPMTPQALNFGSRLSYSQSQISLFHSTSSLPLSTASTSVSFEGTGRLKEGKDSTTHLETWARPRDKKKGRGPPRIPVPAVPPKIDKSVDDEVVKIEIDESLG